MGRALLKNGSINLPEVIMKIIESDYFLESEIGIDESLLAPAVRSNSSSDSGVVSISDVAEVFLEIAALHVIPVLLTGLMEVIFQVCFMKELHTFQQRVYVTAIYILYLIQQI